MNGNERKKLHTPTPSAALNALAAGLDAADAGTITLLPMTALHHLALERTGNAHVALPNPVTGEAPPAPSLQDHMRALALLTLPPVEAWKLSGDPMALDLAGAELLGRVRDQATTIQLIRALCRQLDSFYAVAPTAEAGAEGPLEPVAAVG